MKKFFSGYQTFVPLIFFPFGYYLWWLYYRGDHALVILTLSLPVIFAYVIPAIGTNWLGLWEFNTRFKLGKFRPHHGFVFGTATSLFALMCLTATYHIFSLAQILRFAFILGTVLSFWNWLYDLHAMKSNFIILNRPEYYKNMPLEIIVSEYSPLYFGTFGVCYAVFLSLVERYLVGSNRFELYWSFFLWGNIAVLTIPVSAYCLFTYFKYGKQGLKSLLTRRRHEKHAVSNT